MIFLYGCTYGVMKCMSLQGKLVRNILDILLAWIYH